MASPESEEAIAHLHSQDLSLVRKATRHFRQISSSEKNPPFRMIIESGILPRLVSLLENDEHPDIQHEVAWTLTNIASGTNSDTEAVVEANVCPHLIRLLSSISEDVREQCAWALGNIAGDSPKNRDLLLSMGCLPTLLTIFSDEKSRISIRRTSSWTLSNLLRGKPAPSMEYAELALPHIVKLIFNVDAEVVTDSCWALSYICDGGEARRQLVLNAHSVIPRLIDLIENGNISVQTPALKVIGSMVSGTDEETQSVLDYAPALPALSKLLSSQKKNIRKEVILAFSNINAGSTAQIQAIIDCHVGIVPKLIELLKADDVDVQAEACWAIANVTNGGTFDQLLTYVLSGAISPMCGMLMTSPRSSEKIVAVAVQGLDQLINAIRRDSVTNLTNASTQIVQVLVATFAQTTQDNLIEHWTKTNISDLDKITDMMWRYSYSANIQALLSWILVMEDLVLYHHFDCSSIIDLFQLL